MACFKISPKVITNYHIMHKFMWNGKEGQDKFLLMAWDMIYWPKGQGGAGLRDWKLLNMVMGTKLVWQIFSQAN